MKRTALVNGATGVAGSYLANHLPRSGTWKVCGASRRRPEYAGIDNFEHVAVDLLDVRDTKQALRPLTDVTHLFSCCYVGLPGTGESIAANVQLVGNPLGVLEESAPRLSRVVLVQGTKYYGCHLGPFLTSAKEFHPRVEDLKFFYYEQEDYVITAQRGKQRSWSAVREDSQPMRPAFVARIRKPADVRAPWDLYEMVATLSAEDAFRPLKGSDCPMAFR